MRSTDQGCVETGFEEGRAGPRRRPGRRRRPSRNTVVAAALPLLVLLALGAAIAWIARGFERPVRNFHIKSCGVT